MIMKIEIYDTLHDDAFKLRREVFTNEQGLIDTPDNTDRVSRHIVMYDCDMPVATCRMAPLYPGCSLLGRIAVKRSYRGRGLGAKIMSFAEATAKALGIEKLKIHAQCHASGFYEKLGYIATDEVDEEQGVAHVWFEKNL